MRQLRKISAHLTAQHSKAAVPVPNVFFKHESGSGPSAHRDRGAVDFAGRQQQRIARVPRGELAATAVLWLTIVLIHAVCGAYYAFLAILYHTIPTTLVGDHMRAFRLTLDLDRFPALVGVFAVCSTLHAAFFLQMLFMTVR